MPATQGYIGFKQKRCQFRHGETLLHIHELINSLKSQLTLSFIANDSCATVFDIAPYTRLTVSAVECSKGSHNYSFTFGNILNDYILKAFNYSLANFLLNARFSGHLLYNFSKTYIVWFRHRLSHLRRLGHNSGWVRWSWALIFLAKS